MFSNRSKQNKYKNINVYIYIYINQKETNKFQLCLTEKTLIILAERNPSLNKRLEIMKKCRPTKMILANIV